MTAITATEISISDIPQESVSGTTLKRVRIYIRATSAGGGTIDLSGISGLADLEGISYYSLDGVNTATVPTWSTTTVTVADATTAAIEMEAVGRVS